MPRRENVGLELLKRQIVIDRVLLVTLEFDVAVPVSIRHSGARNDRFHLDLFHVIAVVEDYVKSVLINLAPINLQEIASF